MNLIYTLTIILGVQLLAFHTLALMFYLYWAIWWFDVMMHILGGIWLLFLIQTFVLLGWYKERFFRPKHLVIVILSAFGLWELFGIYVAGGFKSDWLTDTALDTLCGIVGAIIGYWLVKRLRQIS